MPDDLALQVIYMLTKLLCHQHKDQMAMSASIDAKLAEIASAIDELGTAVQAEIQQLADSIANSGGLTEAQAAQFDSIRDKVRGMVSALKADDAPAPPVDAVDPAALAVALDSARSLGATDVQLQAITSLPSPVTKAQLADALTAAQAAAADGSAPATPDQLTALLALIA